MSEVHNASAAPSMGIKRALSATVIRACVECGAPGVYQDDPSIKAGWPRLYVEAGSPLAKKPVGDVCPQCLCDRLPNEDRGVIWEGSM